MDNQQNSIAIIGAGPSGLIAAKVLADQGYKISIYEKENRVGGKCHTVSIDGDRVDVGAVICPKIRYPLLQKLIRQLNIDTEKLPLPISPMEVNAAGNFKPIIRANPPISELLRYALLSINYYRYCSSNYFHLYRKNFFDFATEHRLPTIGEIIADSMYSLGYGDIKTIPTWYILHFINLRMLLGCTLPGKQSNYILQGLEYVWETLANELLYKGVQCCTNTEAKQIIRKPDRIEIHTDRINVHSHVIFSCSPDCIMRLLHERSQDENELLHAITYSPCSTVLVDFEVEKKPTFPIYQILSPHPEIAMIGIWPSRKSNCLYGVIYVTHQKNGDANQIFQLDSQQQKEWFSQHLAIPSDWKIKKIICRNHWPNYFPHFKADQPDNPFQILKKLQGVNRTYYIGGWCSFDLIESVLEHAFSTIKNYFPNRQLGVPVPPESDLTPVKAE